jgi:hypothetical protein
MGAPAMNIATIGIDLAKNVFQLHGVTEEQRSGHSRGSAKPNHLG